MLSHYGIIVNSYISLREYPLLGQSHRACLHPKITLPSYSAALLKPPALLWTALPLCSSSAHPVTTRGCHIWDRVHFSARHCEPIVDWCGNLALCASCFLRKSRSIRTCCHPERSRRVCSMPSRPRRRLSSLASCFHPSRRSSIAQHPVRKDLIFARLF